MRLRFRFTLRFMYAAVYTADREASAKRCALLPGNAQMQQRALVVEEPVQHMIVVILPLRDKVHDTLSASAKRCALLPGNAQMQQRALVVEEPVQHMIVVILPLRDKVHDTLSNP